MSTWPPTHCKDPGVKSCVPWSLLGGNAVPQMKASIFIHHPTNALARRQAGATLERAGQRWRAGSSVRMEALVALPSLERMRNELDAARCVLRHAHAHRPAAGGCLTSRKPCTAACPPGPSLPGSSSPGTCWQPPAPHHRAPWGVTERRERAKERRRRTPRRAVMLRCIFFCAADGSGGGGSTPIALCSAAAAARCISNTTEHRASRLVHDAASPRLAQCRSRFRS
jgi:hypothetical protein